MEPERTDHTRSPAVIINNIPETINHRLSSISSNEPIFNNAAPPYQEALQKSGYNYKLKFKPNQTNDQQRKRNRQRKIAWFNPPYSSTVSTNIGKKFFTLIDTCFPPGHKLRKVINRNTVKLSYSCMPNLKQTISAHNKSVLKTTNATSTVSTQPKSCNCWPNTVCPLDGNCQASGAYV